MKKTLTKSNDRMKAAGYRLIASWLPKADARAVEAIAKRETISSAAIIRRAVRDLLAKDAT